MRILYISLCLASLGLPGSAHALSPCFRTPTAAASQSGPQTSQGFSLETIRPDLFTHETWASVRSCAHPEQPARLIHVLNPQATHPLPTVYTPAPTLIRAGAQVTVVRVSAASRLQIQGIAQSNAALGAPLQVRLITANTTQLFFLSGTVRSAELVEIEE